MSSNSMNRRVDRLEATVSDSTPKRVFLWFAGQSLAEALASQHLTFDDQPLMAIRIEGIHPGEREPRWDAIFERDKALLQSSCSKAVARIAAGRWEE